MQHNIFAVISCEMLSLIVAYAAGIQFSDAKPLGYTFGSPKLFNGGCDVIDSTRWFRFINSWESQYRMEIGYPQGRLFRLFSTQSNP